MNMPHRMSTLPERDKGGMGGRRGEAVRGREGKSDVGKGKASRSVAPTPPRFAWLAPVFFAKCGIGRPAVTARRTSAPPPLCLYYISFPPVSVSQSEPWRIVAGRRDRTCFAKKKEKKKNVDQLCLHITAALCSLGEPTSPVPSWVALSCHFAVGVPCPLQCGRPTGTAHHAIGRGHTGTQKSVRCRRHFPSRCGVR